MEFRDRLIELRKSRGWSQEELGNRINVSRQTVSKWETGETTPELGKLVALSELFGTGLDELVKGERTSARSRDHAAVDYRRYEYKSRRSWKGIPLVHINLGRGFYIARGVLAIGNIAVGAVALGGVSLGIVSAGFLGIGLLSLAAFAFGLAALGGLCVGLAAAGGLAVGYVAVGGLAAGVYAAGGCAIARDIAVGGYAQGIIAVGQDVRGEVLFSGSSQGSGFQKEDFIRAVDRYFPEMNRFIRNVISALVWGRTD